MVSKNSVSIRSYYKRGKTGMAHAIERRLFLKKRKLKIKETSHHRNGEIVSKGGGKQARGQTRPILLKEGHFLL